MLKAMVDLVSMGKLKFGKESSLCLVLTLKSYNVKLIHTIENALFHFHGHHFPVKSRALNNPLQIR